MTETWAPQGAWLGTPISARARGLALSPPRHRRPPEPARPQMPRPDLGEAVAEAGEHLLHVAPLLHGDDPQVVLLIHPHQEGLVVIVPGGRGTVKPLPPTLVSGHSRKKSIGGPQAPGPPQVLGAPFCCTGDSSSITMRAWGVVQKGLRKP